MDKATYIAATRFGLGASVGDPSSISDPRAWLLSQVQQREQNLSDFSSLTSSQNNLKMIIEAKKEAKKSGVRGHGSPLDEFKKIYRKYFIAEMNAKIKHAITTTTPFYEHLVDFWSNHFSVNHKKDKLVGIAGAYEREAIRPYITGKFVDMLMAVEKHPAMLYYLDNAQSIGPDSKAGKKMSRGLNENLAREIMELHSLGVNGGYTQADVTTFASVITGWTVGGIRPDSAGTVGSFSFEERMHEAGAKTIMGKTYPDDGVGQGEAVLRDLAIHPATAKFIAFKLARHFIADVPPASAVDALAKEFQNTGGDLKAVYAVLLNLADSWTLAAPKVKSNYHLMVSAARLAGQDVFPTQWCLQGLNFLGDAPFTAPSPAGFSDVTSDMIGSEALLRRVEWARAAGASRGLGRKSAKDLGELAIGAIMSKVTRDAISNAPRPDLAFALLLGSPEFQRR